MQEAGRLLPCGVDEWVHVNCAVWSAEVYEECSGVLCAVHAAISRGKMLVSEEGGRGRGRRKGGGGEGEEEEGEGESLSLCMFAWSAPPTPPPPPCRTRLLKEGYSVDCCVASTSVITTWM